MTSHSMVKYLLKQYMQLKGAASKGQEKGFTLPELLLVCCIILILFSIIIPVWTGFLYKARRAEADLNIATFIKAQQQFYLKNNRFADNMDELEIAMFTDNPHFGYRVDTNVPASSAGEAICIFSYERNSSTPTGSPAAASLGCAAKIQLSSPSSQSFSSISSSSTTSGTDLESNLDVLYKMVEFERGYTSDPINEVSFTLNPAPSNTYNFMTCAPPAVPSAPQCKEIN